MINKLPPESYLYNPGPLGMLQPPKPYFQNYPPQTQSVIYFWNPWVKTTTILHSNHLKGPQSYQKGQVKHHDNFHKG